MADGFLILMVGVPGSGKSFLARILAGELGAEIVQTDAVRKELFPRPRYTPAEMRSVYAVSHRRVSAGLAAGRRVIFDATNLRERSRTALYRIAERSAAGLVVIVAYAPESVIRSRLAERRRAPDPNDLSDADWVIYSRMVSTSEPVARPHLVANTTASPKPLLRVLRGLLGPKPTP